METLIDKLPEIIREAAQSNLGILALLSIALSVLAYLFFAKSSEKIKVGIFALLFFGVIGFGSAMFLARSDAPNPVPPNPPPATLGQVAWFYAGAWRDGRWVQIETRGVTQPSTTTNSNKVAAVGNTYKITEPVNFREFPASNQKMSQSLAILNKGTCVKAQEILQIPQKSDNSIWVWIRGEATCLPSE